MSDLIDRQAAIDAVRKCSVKEVTPVYMLIDKAEVMTELMLLPSAQPERKTGRWMATEADEPCFYRCSECGRLIDERENFCPNCGADMREGEG